MSEKVTIIISEVPVGQVTEHFRLILTIKTGIASVHPRVALASGDLSLVQDLPFPHLIKYHMWDKSLAGGGTEAAAEYIVLFFILFS